MSLARRWKRRHPPCVMCGEPTRAHPGALALCDECRPMVTIRAVSTDEVADLVAEGACDCADCLGVVVCEPWEDCSCPG